MLLSCIPSCCTALWSPLQHPDSRFHPFVSSHDRFILHCNLHKKLYPSFLPSLCSPPTHIYRHAATDKLNLDSAVAQLYLIMLLHFHITGASIQLFSSLFFYLIQSHFFLRFSAPFNSTKTPLQQFHSHLSLLGGGEGHQLKTKIDLSRKSLVKLWVTVR